MKTEPGVIMSGFSSFVTRLAGALCDAGCRSNQRRCSSRTTSTGDPAVNIRD